MSEREPDMDELRGLEQADADNAPPTNFFIPDDEDGDWEDWDEDEDDDPDAYICPGCEQYAEYCECDDTIEELWPLDENGREI